MRVDTFEVTQHVDMQGTCLDAFLPSLAQPSEMGLGCQQFDIAQPGLLLDERTCDFYVVRHEHAEGQPEIVQDAVMEVFKFLRALCRNRHKRDMPTSGLCRAVAMCGK